MNETSTVQTGAVPFDPALAAKRKMASVASVSYGRIGVLAALFDFLLVIAHGTTSSVVYPRLRRTVRRTEILLR